jgi:hypothetical protein
VTDFRRSCFRRFYFPQSLLSESRLQPQRFSLENEASKKTELVFVESHSRDNTYDAIEAAIVGYPESFADENRHQPHITELNSVLDFPHRRNLGSTVCSVSRRLRDPRISPLFAPLHPHFGDKMNILFRFNLMRCGQLRLRWHAGRESETWIRFQRYRIFVRFK